MSISRGWIAALAVAALMVAGAPQAAPVLYTFTGGSAVLRVTSGAFSREGPAGNPFFLGVECLLKRENCHPYRSFDQARDELNCGATGWRVSGLMDFRNRYPVSAGLSFSTGDHSGVLVFERSS